MPNSHKAEIESLAAKLTELRRDYGTLSSELVDTDCARQQAEAATASARETLTYIKRDLEQEIANGISKGLLMPYVMGVDAAINALKSTPQPPARIRAQPRRQAQMP